MADTHPCGHCKGSGRIELTGVYADTLALLRKQKEWVSGAEMAKLFGCANEAMCNRLVAIEDMGYARSRRYGRARQFEAVIQKRSNK